MNNSEEIEKAYKDGEKSVRMKPRYAPLNPYDDETQPDLYQSWEDGAISAGICDIYRNGRLIP